MKFFKPEDFGHLDIREDHARMANAKLEKEGRVVYGSWFRGGVFDESDIYTILKNCKSALLINIEPIEKCEHPRHMVHLSETEGSKPSGYFCTECGERVTPKAFETV